MNLNEFKDNVRACMRTGNGLTKDEFERIDKEYDAFGNLQKYSLSSWMAGEFPELDQAVRTRNDGWELYQMLGGPVERTPGRR